MAAIIALVALRVTIGLHFSVEGINKFIDPKPYSAGFLLNSKGPLAPMFQNMVWDKDGLARLNAEQTKAIWTAYRERAVNKYGVDAKRAQEIQKQREAQLKWILDTNAEDIHEYLEGLKRRDQYRADPKYQEVDSLRGQLAKVEQELSSKARELLGPIDQVWAGYERDMNALATQGGGLALPRAGRRWLDSETIDVIIRYFDLAVGICLIFGLATRLAAGAGCLFLLSICISQWPWAPGAVPVWYQFIEAVAMAVLVTTAAGRFAGLDAVIAMVRASCCPPKQGS